MMYDSEPDAMPWLLDAAFQANTSSVMAPPNSSLMYSTAAMVSGELMITFSSSSWTEPPKDHSRARPAMFESISWDMPMPSWTPWLVRISRPPSSSSSQVEGPSGRPTASHRDLRYLP